MTTLYLLPCPIAESAMDTLPSSVIDRVRDLEYFVVERAKTARHFVKACAHPRPISELTFVELTGAEIPTEVLELLDKAFSENKGIGILSEAGCPGVADPGAALVALAHRRGIPVKPMVGPSSILLALMASGMNGQQFTFHGYLSAKRPELARDLRRLEQLSRSNRQTQIFMDTPYRNQAVLETAVEALSPDTLFGVAYDLTGPGESIRVADIKTWKNRKVVIEKAPSIFLLSQP